MITFSPNKDNAKLANNGDSTSSNVRAICESDQQNQQK